MFSISTKGDYGLQILLHLAKNKENSFVSMQEIATENKLSAQYLAQIMMPLKNAGFIESKEGKGGGHRLSRKPSQMSMLEILESLEGPITLVKCLDVEGKQCKMLESCGAKKHFSKFLAHMRDYFAGITLADLIE